MMATMLVVLHSIRRDLVHVNTHTTYMVHVCITICMYFACLYIQKKHTQHKTHMQFNKSIASASEILTITCFAKLILQIGQPLTHLEYLHITCHALDHHS